jgi:hypothetical protein
MPKRYVPEKDSAYQVNEDDFRTKGYGRVGIASMVTGASVLGVYIGSIWARPSENWDEEAIPLPRPTVAGFEGVLMTLRKNGFPEADITQDVDELYQHAATTWSSALAPRLDGTIL